MASLLHHGLRTRAHALLTRKQTPYRLAAFTVVAILLYLGKRYYSTASADDLRWVLAPTAQLVSWGNGADFVYETGTGWVSRELWFVIAPGCAGLNFLLTAFVALAVGGLGTVCNWRTMVSRLALAAGLAYAATLLVNTARILIACELHLRRTRFLGLDPSEVHQVEGTAVYLVGLCGLYALARALNPSRPRGRSSHAVVH